MLAGLDAEPGPFHVRGFNTWLIHVPDSLNLHMPLHHACRLGLPSFSRGKNVLSPVSITSDCQPPETDPQNICRLQAVFQTPSPQLPWGIAEMTPPKDR